MAQLRPVTEIAPKSPFLCMNRSPSVRYDFRRSQHQFRGSPKKREFDRVPKPTTQKFGKKGERDVVLEYKYQRMSILRKKSHTTLDVFLSTNGLFSIKIKVSFNAEIFLMDVPYRLVHDCLLILTPKEVTSF